LVPGRRFFPLGFSRKAQSVRSGEGVGLEPGDVDDRPVRMEWLQSRQTPLALQVRRPAPWSGDVVVLLPAPAFVGPPLAPLVTTPLHERQIRRIGDRRAPDQVAAHI